MLLDVTVVLFSPRSGCPCREMALLRETGRPALVLPSTKLERRETTSEAASRLIKSLGSEVVPSLWKFAGAVHTGTTAVLTAIVSAETLSLLDDKKIYTGAAEMLMCDAWVNPQNYQPDFLSILAMARASHVKN